MIGSAVMAPLGSLVALLAAIGDISYAATGALAATIATAGVQYLRGRSQSRVDDETVNKLRAETTGLIDSRWASLSERLDEDNRALRDEREDLRHQVADLRDRVRTLERRERELEDELERLGGRRPAP